MSQFGYWHVLVSIVSRLIESVPTVQSLLLQLVSLNDCVKSIYSCMNLWRNVWWGLGPCVITQYSHVSQPRFKSSWGRRYFVSVFQNRFIHLSMPFSAEAWGFEKVTLVKRTRILARHPCPELMVPSREDTLQWCVLIHWFLCSWQPCCQFFSHPLILCSFCFLIWAGAVETCSVRMYSTSFVLTQCHHLIFILSIKIKTFILI